MTKKRILITGANGFLGRHVYSEFKDYYFDHMCIEAPELITFRSKDYNLIDLNETMMLFEKEKPDVVIHLAAVAGGIGFNSRRPADILQSNLFMSVNLFEAIYKYRPEYVYVAGSICEYPKYCSVPFKEEDLWKDREEEFARAYAFGKKALLTLQQEYRNQYCLKGAHFLIANLYGNHDNFSLDNSHVVGALIRKFVDAVDEGKDVVECWGTGKAERDLLFVQDIAKAIVKAAVENFDNPEPINIGTGKSILIKDLAEMIAELVGFKGRIVFTGKVSDGQPRRQLDISKAKKLLNWEAKTNLLTGLVKTIGWYEDNKEKIKKEENGKL